MAKRKKHKQSQPLSWPAGILISNFDRFQRDLTERIEQRLAQDVQWESKKIEESWSVELMSRARPETDKADLNEAFKQYFNSEDLSDVLLKFGDVQMPAHRLILSARSGYFKKTFGAGLIEDKMREVKFDSGHEHAYFRVFQYVYTGDYSESASPNINVPGTHFSRHLVRELTLYR